jgi:hypothetical protein
VIMVVVVFAVKSLALDRQAHFKRVTQLHLHSSLASNPGPLIVRIHGNSPAELDKRGAM